jgi:hypothetical protein
VYSNLLVAIEVGVFCLFLDKGYANMLAAYFAKGYDSRELFKGLKISKIPEFEEHMNQHHVIYIDLSRLPDPWTSFQEYFNNIVKMYHMRN